MTMLEIRKLNRLLTEKLRWSWWVRWGSDVIAEESPAMGEYGERSHVTDPFLIPNRHVIGQDQFLSRLSHSTHREACF